MSNVGSRGVRVFPLQPQLEDLAYDVERKLQQRHVSTLSTGMIPPAMRLLGIMPLRHATTTRNLGVLQRDVEAGGFAQRPTGGGRATGQLAPGGRTGRAGQDEKGSEGAVRSQQHDDDTILEYFLLKTNMSKALDHVVARTLGAFIHERNVLRTGNARFNSSRRAASAPRGKHDGALAARVPLGFVRQHGCCRHAGAPARRGRRAPARGSRLRPARRRGREAAPSLPRNALQPRHRGNPSQA